MNNPSRASVLQWIQRRRGAALFVLVVLAGQALLLAVVAARHRAVFNPDAVAYVRLADNWRTGQWHLAVSGYWGPAFCWLLAPIRLFVADPAAAGRVAMAISASLFTATCAAPLYVLGLRGWRWAAAWLVAATLALEWSVHGICPDVLLSAVLNMALAMLLTPRWSLSGHRAFATGALFGAAYLVKAIALPLAALSVLAVIAFRGREHGTSRAALLSSGLKTALGIALVAGPWIAALSLKYQRLTFSTSASIAHAVVGPHGKFGEHPVVTTLHAVEPGRITAWEDPSGMAYPYWQAWQSADAARHQARLCLHNAQAITRWLGRFDALHLGLVALILALVPWRRMLSDDDQAWRWMFVPTAGLAAIYLPVYAENSRYYFPLYPWVLGGAVAACQAIAARLLPRRTWATNLAVAFVLASFALVAVEKSERAWRPAPPETPYALACELAAQLSRNGSNEPLFGGREVGMYLALLTNRPWLGHDPSAPVDAVASTVDAVAGSGAALLLVWPYDASQVDQFMADPRCQVLSGETTATTAENHQDTDGKPVVFRIRSHAQQSEAAAVP